MENKKIWHTPHEILPDEDHKVIFTYPGFVFYGIFHADEESFEDFESGDCYLTHEVKKWAYVNQVLDVCNALDAVD